MTDDIVTRLRMSADLVDGFPKALAKNLFPKSWLSEAADEIERLRADLENVRDMNEHLTQELQSYYNEDEEIRRGRSGD